MNVTFQNIQLTQITVGKTNPRKHFDDAALQELAESIRKQGVVQPILVRPRLGNNFELVAGERRLKAAKIAGLEVIPATIRELADADVLEIQVVENLQRADLHPLEEAEGYELLMKQHQYTADQLAAKVGKSKAYIYARLKLCALVPEARKAFYDGGLNPSVALLVARIADPALQKEALKEVAFTAGGLRDAMSYREARDFIHDRYMLELTGAPFPVADAELCPKAGACTACPKRTGNQPELFADVKSGDVCTDPGCFDGKRQAQIVRLTKAAEKSGVTVITGKAAEKLAAHGMQYGNPKGYRVLDREQYELGHSKKLRTMLGKDKPPVVLIEDRRTGQLVECVAEKDVAHLFKRKSNDGRSDADKKREQKLREKQKRETEILQAIHAATRDKVAADGFDLEDMRAIALTQYKAVWHQLRLEIAKRWIPESPKKNDDRVFALEKQVATMPGPDLFKLIVDCTLATAPKALDAMAKRHGVDAAAIRKGFATAAAKKAPVEKKVKAPRDQAPPAWMKPVTPDAHLAAIVGTEPLKRTDITSKLWAYVKKNGLQDKVNRRNINADEKLLPIFKNKKSVTMFEMTKLIAEHFQ